MKSLRAIKLCLLILHLIAGLKSLSAQDKMTISPNPFIDSAHINFNIIESGKVSLTVFNVIGEMVNEFYKDSFLSAGSHTVSFYRNFLPKGIYFVRLKTVSANSINLQVIIENPVSGITKNHSPDVDIKVFPNPANTEITISFCNDKGKILCVNIYDQAGKQVFTTQHNGSNIKINLRELENGIYILLIPELNYCSKLVVTQ